MTVRGMTALSLCFIGGWGSTEEAWRGTLDCVVKDCAVPTFASNFRTQMWATPNRETSEGGAPARCEAHFLNWLECIRDWPGALAKLRGLPGRCVLVGWSLGGLLALRAALDWELELEQQPELTRSAELPGEVAAMVLVSATPRMCADGDYAGVDRRTLAAMRARLEKSLAAVLQDFAQQCAAPDGNQETCRSWLRQAGQFSVEEMAAGLECLASLDLRERLVVLFDREWALHTAERLHPELVFSETATGVVVRAA